MALKAENVLENTIYRHLIFHYKIWNIHEIMVLGIHNDTDKVINYANQGISALKNYCSVEI